MTTDYAKRSEILKHLWVNHNDNEIFEEFIDLNDLGLPMAYFISQGIVESTPMAEDLVNQSFQALLDMFEVDDRGFKSLQEIINTRA